MKKISGAVAIGLFGFCVLGVFIRGAFVPSRTNDETDHTREINRDRKAVTGNPPAYQFEKVDADGTLAVSNSTREIKASLHPSFGVAVESLAGEGWNCRIQLKGLGRSEFMPVEGLVKPAKPTSGHAVEFSGSVDQVQLTEWFENGVHGLEQGWTLTMVPDGESREKGMPLKMRLEVESDLLPRITEDRRNIAFHQVAESKAGPVALRYQNLKAFDATGASVQAWFELPESGDSGIDIMVADAGAVYPLTIDPCFAADMADKQFGDDTNDDDYFGHAIAVSGDWAAISAPGKTDGSSDGRVYMFNKSVDGIWSQKQSFTTITGFGNGGFGESLDIDGDLLVIGSSGDGGDAGGAHYIYRLNQANAWIAIDKQSVPNSGPNIGSYGRSVAIVDHSVVGAAIAVGAPTSSGGSVFVYKENQGGVGNWGLATTLTPSVQVAGFGSDVAIDAKDALSSDVLAVAVGTRGPGTLAYVFDEQKLWSGQELLPSSVSETIGQVVELDVNENLIAVGAGDEGVGFDSVILFSEDINGTWQDVVVIPAPSQTESFGVNLALNGTSLAIYAYTLSNSSPPSDYVFLHEENEGGAGNWGRVDIFTQPDLLPDGSNDNYFGEGGLALTDDELVVGAVSDVDATDGMSTPFSAGAAYFIPAEEAVYDFSTDAYTLVEDDDGVGAITVVRSGCIDAAGSIEVVLSSGSINPASLAEDYSNDLILVTFAAGQSIALVDFPIVDDAIFESDETVALSFSSIIGGGAVGTTNPSATLTIENDDSLPVVRVDDITVSEGAGQVDFVLTVTGESAFSGTVDVATADGTAEAGLDYTTRSATISIPAGSATVVASVLINDDLFDELDETFTLALSNGTNLALNDLANVAVATITDNDVPSAVSIDDVSVAEGGGAVTFTLTLAGDSDLGRSVNFATVDGSAVAGSDYVANSGTVTIPAGDTSATIDMTILDDTLAEATTESFSVMLSAPVNVTIADDTGVATITDDDALPAVSVSDVQVAEDGATAAFVLTLAGSSAAIATVNYTTTDGTASAGSDFTATSGTATFESGISTVTVNVPIADDVLDESNVETFTLDLSNPIGMTIADGSGTGSITDNDLPPAVAVADAVVDEGGGNAQFVVSLVGQSAVAGSVDFVVADGTAAAGSDYTTTSGTLAIPAGALTLEISVPVLNDLIDEADSETFTLTLSNPVNVTIADAVATGTITDNDDPPTLAVDDVTVAEGAGVASFVVTVTGESAFAGSVDFATSNGTATAGSDYTATTGTVPVPAGAASVTIPVTILDDTVSEASAETFTLTLRNPLNATLSDATATGTITDDEGLSTVMVGDVTAIEGSDGAEFVLTVSGESALARTVTYETVDGTAIAGSDYAAASGTATIPAGATTTTVLVGLIDDAVHESDTETFSLILTGSQDLTIVSGEDTGTATITDDDDSPTVSVSDVQIAENGQTANFQLTVTGASALERSVSYTTADGTAVAGSDYTTTNGIATFAVGTDSVTVSVPVLNDQIDEPDTETFTLTLSTPVNLTIADASGTATITDDDLPPAVSIADATAAEGSAGLVFVVSIAGTSVQAGSVSYATSNGTALAGSDYTAASGTLSIPAGTTTLSIPVQVIDDLLDEADLETLTLTLMNPVNVTLADGTATGSITDNDSPGTVSVADVTVAENAGQASFVISVSGASDVQRSVAYATMNGTALAGSDYTATSGTATFEAGVNSVTVNVPITDDELDESDTETFDLVLSAPVGLTIESGVDIATATITDNDAPGVVSVDSVTVAENAGSAVFTLTVVGSSDLTRTVAYATSDGTALAGSDYTTTSGIATFAAGVNSATVSVPIIDDVQDEADAETFNLTLSAPVNLAIASGAGTGTGTITDNDAPASLVIGNVEIAENGSAVVFEVTVTGATDSVISVDFATSDGTATAGSDYTATSGTLQIPVDISGPATISVPILDDALDEDDSETFTLTLSAPVNAVIGQATGTGSILDNDDAPVVSVGDADVTEGTGVIASFAVTLSAVSGRSVGVDLSTVAGTALAGADFTAQSSTVTIAPGATSATFSVSILNDADREFIEDFTVSISAASNATVGDAIGDGVISDDDGGRGATLVFEAGSVPSVVLEPDKSTPLADGDLIQVGALLDPADISSFVVFGEMTVTSAGADGGLIAGQVTGTFSDASTFTGKAIFLRIYNAPTPEQSTAYGVFGSGGNAWIFPATSGNGVGDTLTLPTSDLSDAPFAGFGSVESSANGMRLSVGGLLPEVKFTDIERGDQGTGVAAAAFAVLLSEPTTHTVIVDVRTVDGSAKAGIDYEAVTQTLVFLPGETEKSVPVNVILDDLDESVEAFVLEATDVVNATMQGDGTRFSVRDEVLNPASGATYFGASVALDGDTMAVGSPLHQDGGVAKGAVFLYERSIASGYDWVLAATLIAADGVDGDGFGESLALNGNLLVVGAPQADRTGLDSGSAYLFGRNQGGVDQWGLIRQLAPGDSIANDNFGSAVAVSGDSATVAARFHDVGDYPDDDGAVYIFSRDSGGQDSWGFEKKLTADTQSFGSALAMDDGRVLVGARDDDAGDLIDTGAAFLYERDLGGAGAWGLRKRMDPSALEAHSSFGYAVAIESEVAVVSAFKAGSGDSGSVGVFTRNTGGADAWGLAASLQPPVPVTDGLFGRSVAVSGDLIAVGATGSSSVFVFARMENPDGWQLLTTLTDPSGNPDGDFGRATAMWAGSLVTALPNADAVAVHRDHLGIGLLNDGPATAGFSSLPSDPAAILSVEVDFAGATINWQSQPDRIYSVQKSSDMRKWSDVATNVYSTGPTTSFRDRSIPSGISTRFYRIVEQAQ
ncbi:MAG: hypothetical protein KDN22_01435 [Verrucomicrobiae bacterium]|nr:hypothetical protein [Verrucomicrobiae bacterium]